MSETPRTDQAVETDPWATLSLDFLKFLVGGLGFGIVLLGYSYSHTFFRSFGLSLFQLDMTSVDIVYRGIALIETPQIGGIFLLVIVGFSVALVLRSHVPQLAGALLASCAILSLLAGTLTLGRSLGQEHAKAIWAGEAGKKVFCRFQAASDDPLAALLPVIEDLARSERLKLIYQNRDTIYLAPQLLVIPEGRTTGESYAIPTSALRFCRIVGT